MNECDLETYMKDGLRLALATRAAFWELDFEGAATMLKRTHALGKKLGRYTVDLVDARIDRAVGEIVDGHSAPPLANLDRNGITAVEICILAERMVAERRKQLRAWVPPKWPGAVGDMVQKLYDEIPKPAQPQAPVAPAPPAEITVAYDGERHLEIAGKTIVLPVPIWRGTHEPSRLYESNDLVTKGGSMWIATVPTTETPGSSGHWRLAVKEGRSARDRDRERTA